MGLAKIRNKQKKKSEKIEIFLKKITRMVNKAQDVQNSNLILDVREHSDHIWFPCGEGLDQDDTDPVKEWRLSIIIKLVEKLSTPSSLSPGLEPDMVHA